MFDVIFLIFLAILGIIIPRLIPLRLSGPSVPVDLSTKGGCATE